MSGAPGPFFFQTFDPTVDWTQYVVDVATDTMTPVTPASYDCSVERVMPA